VRDLSFRAEVDAKLMVVVECADGYLAVVMYPLVEEYGLV
jgi:hypothetical protein